MSGEGAAWLVVVMLACAPSGWSEPQQVPALSLSEESTGLRVLFTEGKWLELLQRLPPPDSGSAEFEYYRGMALARLGNWRDAQRAFRSGLQMDPRDKRFPLELAGTSFKLGDLRSARSYLHRALELDPGDRYAADFMATLFLLGNNPEAALKYWNGAGKPRIDRIRTDPNLRVDPVLLDRAFVAAPASLLSLRDYLETRDRLESLGIFSRMRLDLAPVDRERFDLVFGGLERNGMGRFPWEALITLARGVPYRTIYPEFYNLNRGAVNLLSLARWDPLKKRMFARVESPFRREPQHRWQAFLDARSEEWQLPGAFGSTPAGTASFNLRKLEAGIGIQSLHSSWNWSSIVSIAGREFRDALPELASSPQLFTGGSSVEYDFDFHHRLWSLPERRMSVSWSGSLEAGRIFRRPSPEFGKLVGSMEAGVPLLPDRNDYRMSARFQAGRILGSPSIDEYFSLGLDRDHEPVFRGHSSTQNGRYGPGLARSYFAWKWDLEKRIFNEAGMEASLGPFLDTGRAYDPRPNSGNVRWLIDVGLQGRVRVLGSVGLVISWGVDTRSGKKAFLVTAVR